MVRFFFESVEANLKDFQGKITQVMKAIRFSFDDFDRVVDPLEFTGVDGVGTVV
jgi:hypothetical protein